MAKKINKETAPAPANPPVDGGYTQGTPFSPQMAGIRMPRFPVQRHFYFYLAASPQSWELLQTPHGWRLYPVVKALFSYPGSNWVRQRSGGAPPDDSKLLARLGKKMTIFTDRENYLVSVPGNPPGWFARWDHIRVYEDGDWEVDTNQEEFNTWRESLITSGRIPKCRDSVIEKLRRRLGRRVRRRSRHEHTSEGEISTDVARNRMRGLDEAVTYLRSIDGTSEGDTE